MKRLITILLVCVLIPTFAFAQGNTLATGASGEDVLKLQQRLIDLELLSGKADGIFGKKTAAAVLQAQRLLRAAGYDVEETGKADPYTAMLLVDDAAENALRTLRPGSSGVRVRELQGRLIDLKLLNGSADGTYGGQTQSAVLRFQQMMAALGKTDIPQDGIATPEIMALLMSDLSRYYFPAPIYFDETQPLSLTPADLYANACILIEATTGEVLFANNADERLYPASTTKIMTLMLALQKNALDQVVTIPQSASDVPEDSSRVPVYPGEEMTFQDLLYGLMIRSGNDAANAVAELTSGSVDGFVDEMNEYAQALGLTGTHFTNPHGYHDPGHYSTARDLAVLTRLGLTDPIFCQIVTCMQYPMAPTQLRDMLVLQNNYEVFDPESDQYIEGAAGVKSGYTSAAGFCYVGAAQREGKTLIAVILGVPGRSRGWMDLRRLFEYGFAL